MSLKDDLVRQWRTGGTLARLLLINIGVFAVLRVADLAFFLFSAEGPDLLSWVVASSNGHRLLRTPWTVITYMFTHWDLLHIFLNMLVLWFIGRIFQDLLGGKRLLGNYLLGGLSGFLLYYLAYNFLPAFQQYAQGRDIAGASAAVMGVFIGLAAYRPNLELHLLLFGRVQLKWVALVYLVIDLISVRQGNNSGGHIAHLGGAIYGYLAARQLRNGRDISLVFVRFLEKLMRPFGRGRSRLRVEKHFAGRRRSDADFNAAKRDQQARVDAILDKISRSGYDSLSKEEKDLLFKAGK